MPERPDTAIRPTEARDLVEARLYDGEDEVIRDALRHLVRARPEARIQLAVHRYRSEDIPWPRPPSWPA